MSFCDCYARVQLLEYMPLAMLVVQNRLSHHRALERAVSEPH
jgi:hypothetical protein